VSPFRCDFDTPDQEKFSAALLTERSIQCILDKSSANEVCYDVLSHKADKISGRRLLYAAALRRGGAKFYRVVNWARSLVRLSQRWEAHNRSKRDAHAVSIP
jgi:hypothetical protein